MLLISASGDRNVAHDTTLMVDQVAVAAADPLGSLDNAVEAFVAGIGACSVSATTMAGHQVWMVLANRVASGSWAYIAAS
jgi:hypothetical protein